MLEVPVIGVGTVLRLERDAWSMAWSNEQGKQPMSTTSLTHPLSWRAPVALTVLSRRWALKLVCGGGVALRAIPLNPCGACVSRSKT